MLRLKARTQAPILLVFPPQGSFLAAADDSPFPNASLSQTTGLYHSLPASPLGQATVSPGAGTPGASAAADRRGSVFNSSFGEIKDERSLRGYLDEFEHWERSRDGDDFGEKQLLSKGFQVLQN